MRIIIFILLKLAEIVAIVFVPYWVGSFFDKYIPKVGQEIGNPPKWALGFIMLTAVAVVILIIGGIAYANWEWAGRIIQ